MIFTNYVHQGTQQKEKYWMCNVYQDNKVCDIQKNTTTTPQSLIFPSSFPTQNWNRKDQIAF